MSAVWLFAALEVVILSGGGDAERNYASHAVHVEQLASLLDDRGVPRNRVTVFWADGTDPAPDRAVRRAREPRHAWLLRGTVLDEPTRGTVVLEQTRFPGWSVEPATRGRLARHLRRLGGRLEDGETLLIAVTDHGERDPERGGDSRINLWEEALSRTELGELLAPIPESVRVVLWMSQCFSGGFSDLARDRANTCGAFSTPPDRVSYGCFPEIVRDAEVGHFQRLTGALSRHETLAAASDETVLTDDTPDTPHLSSDALLHELAAEAAAGAGRPLSALVDAALAEPDAERPLVVSEISRRYGLPRLESYRAVLDRLADLDDARSRVRHYREVWKNTLDDGRRLLAQPFADEVAGLDPERPPEKRLELRGRLAGKVHASAGEALLGELGALRAKVSETGRLLTRIELYDAALRRVGFALLRAAEPHLPLSDAARGRLRDLRACESAPLMALPADSPAGVLSEADPAPPLASLSSALEAVRPGRLGVTFRVEQESVRLGRVFAGSPADAAGLRDGDRLVRVGGVPAGTKAAFPRRVRLTAPGETLELVRRSGDSDEPVRVVIGAERTELPERACGDRVDLRTLRELARTTAPPVDENAAPPPVDRPVRADRRGLLLFFWATWCERCKEMLPLVEAWSRERGTPVVAVTSEPEAVVGEWLAERRFPLPVLLDPRGVLSRRLGVRALPAYILLDGEGRWVDDGVGAGPALPLTKSAARCDGRVMLRGT